MIILTFGQLIKTLAITGLASSLATLYYATDNKLKAFIRSRR